MISTALALLWILVRTEKHQPSAEILGYHLEWAVLTPAAANQALNSGDSSLFTYGKFWPVLAALHGVSLTEDLS